MKALGLWPLVLACALSPAAAQVSVELTQEQQQFLPAESIPITVRITNRSGQSLHLGQTEDWLTFSVEGRESQVVRKLGDVPMAGEFELDSSKVATLHADLAPYFLLNRPGRYSVTASVQLKDWNQTARSQPKAFDIIEGTHLWEQAVGMPEAPSAGSATPEIRKYILQQAPYIKSQLRLYLRLTDAAGDKTFRVLSMGQMVSFGRPEPQVDKFSNLHLLCQDGPRSFTYSVVNPEGEIVARRTYDYGPKRPHLAPDAEGKVLVMGGTRRVTAKDIPPPKSENAADDGPKPKPSPGELMLPEP